MLESHQFCEVKAGGLHILESVLNPSSLSESKYDCSCSVSVDILVLLGEDGVFFYQDCLMSDAGPKSSTRVAFSPCISSLCHNRKVLLFHLGRFLPSLRHPLKKYPCLSYFEKSSWFSFLIFIRSSDGAQD